jgi:hypothetical protein
MDREVPWYATRPASASIYPRLGANRAPYVPYSSARGQGSQAHIHRGYFSRRMDRLRTLENLIGMCVECRVGEGALTSILPKVGVAGRRGRLTEPDAARSRSAIENPASKRNELMAQTEAIDAT